MSVLTVSLPEDVSEWVEQEAASSGATPDDFVGQLARQAKAMHAKKEAELEQLLLDGLNSGPGQPINEDWWKTVRAGVEERLTAQKAVNGQAYNGKLQSTTE